MILTFGNPRSSQCGRAALLWPDWLTLTAVTHEDLYDAVVSITKPHLPQRGLNTHPEIEINHPSFVSSEEKTSSHPT